MPAHYFLGNRLIASGGKVWWKDLEPGTFSTALFCTNCGDLWGRVVDDEAQAWHVSNTTCQACATKVRFTRGCPGSFIPVWLKYIDNLPRELLLYEVNLRINLITQGVQYGL